LISGARHVDDAASRRTGRVESMATQQDHVGVAQRGSGGVDIEMLGHDAARGRVASWSRQVGA